MDDSIEMIRGIKGSFILTWGFARLEAGVRAPLPLRVLLRVLHSLVLYKLVMLGLRRCDLMKILKDTSHLSSLHSYSPFAYLRNKRETLPVGVRVLCRVLVQLLVGIPIVGQRDIVFPADQRGEVVVYAVRVAHIPADPQKMMLIIQILTSGSKGRLSSYRRSSSRAGRGRPGCTEAWRGTWWSGWPPRASYALAGTPRSS